MYQLLKILIVSLLIPALYACDSGSSAPSGPSQTFATDSEAYQPVGSDGSVSAPFSGPSSLPATPPVSGQSPGAMSPPFSGLASEPVLVPKLDAPGTGMPSVLFLSADWRFTAELANRAFNLPELTVVRNTIESVFPASGLVAGTWDLACASGSARASTQGPVSIYEFSRCTKGGVTLDGYYRVDSSTVFAGLERKIKLDDDFDIRLISGAQEIYIAGNSKYSVLEGPADACGFSKYESVLRQDVLQVISNNSLVNNLAVEDVVSTQKNTSPDGSCRLPTQTLAFSGSATVTPKQAGQELFAVRANRNGLLRTTVGQFVNAGETQNAVLNIYHTPTDALLKVLAVNLDNARVSIRDGVREIGDFTAGFAFK